MDDDDRSGSGSPPAPPRGPARLDLKIQAEERVAQGVYSNSALVNLSENDVTLDFLYIPPQSTVGHLRSRVILSPRQAKQLVRVLGESVARFEERFGPIPEPRRRDPVLH
ncbi:MAG: DUF3467 domain-containing protein [Myxococcota bacterium]|jgi:hypothetical protein|nr:DUF3467 domain-containing protein [Myxococcota bacterium]